MKIVKKDNKNNPFFIDTKEVKAKEIGILKNEIVLKILNSIKEKGKYPKQIAREIKVHEQNVYYYIKKLEKSKIIKIEKSKEINGTIANFYSLKNSSFFIKIKEFQKGKIKLEKVSKYFENFIENGELNSLIIVGSPEPHGKNKTIATDGHFGMDFCLFLGSYLNSITFSKVKLDTQTTKEDLKNNNLILIGGWFVNMVTKKMNELLSIKFNEKTKTIKSKVSQKEYGGRTIGIIYKTKNPFNKNKNILTISGIKKKGTESAILTFLKKFEEIEKGNVFNRKIHLKIIEGIDMNSDGGISEIEILE